MSNFEIKDIFNFTGEKYPQSYGRGIPKEVIKAKDEQEAKIKNDNDLEHQLYMVNQQLNAANQTNKQKDEKINFLENALSIKAIENTNFVNSIFPEIKKLATSIENLNEKFDMIEDNFDGKLYAVLEKIDVLENKTEVLHATVRTIPAEILTDVSKISTNQTTQIVSEIGELPDVIDAIVRTRIGETADVINTKIVSETTKIHEAIINIPKLVNVSPALKNMENIMAKNDTVMSELWKIHELVANQPKTVDVSPALENIRNGLFEGFKYVCKCDEGVTEIIKRHIDLIPRHQSIDLSKIEGRIEQIEDNTNFLVNETDEKIDDIKEVVEALKKDPSKDPSKMPTVPSNDASNTSNNIDIKLDPSKDPSKVPTVPSNDASNIEDLKLFNLSSITEDLKPSKDPSKVSTVPSNDDEFKELSQNQRKVAKYIKNNSNQSQEEISEALNMDRGTLSKVIRFLVDEKYIIKNEDNTYV